MLQMHRKQTDTEVTNKTHDVPQSWTNANRPEHGDGDRGQVTRSGRGTMEDTISSSIHSHMNTEQLRHKTEDGGEVR